jgi:hypothetical protein
MKATLYVIKSLVFIKAKPFAPVRICLSFWHDARRHFWKFSSNFPQRGGRAHLRPQ